MKNEQCRTVRCRIARLRSAFFILHFSFFIVPFLLTSVAQAKPSQTDVFKSIQDSVGESEDSSGKILPWACGGIGLIIILAIFGRRQARNATPRILNHPGRLMKEVMDEIALKPKEIKQLKIVADEVTDEESETPINPLVLLLCPSVLSAAITDDSTRADRKALKTLMKKLVIK